MISKKIYIKEKNILDIRGTSYGVTVIRTCIFIITLLAFTSIALALSWDDKGLAVDDCTETAIKKWKSEKLNFHNKKTINIKGNKIHVQKIQGRHFLRNKAPAGRSTTLSLACNQAQTIQSCQNIHLLPLSASRQEYLIYFLPPTASASK
jgi:hypothetical protein